MGNVPPTLVIDKLWIGTVYDACNTAWLRKQNITHIVDVSDMSYPIQKQTSLGIAFKRFPIKHRPDFTIHPYFEPCNKFIHDARTAPEDVTKLKQNGNVLVHCHIGKHRSATIIVAYLMSALKIDTGAAIALLKAKRPMVEIRGGFERQLQQYDLDLKMARQFAKEETEEENKRTTPLAIPAESPSVPLPPPQRQTWTWAR